MRILFEMDERRRTDLGLVPFDRAWDFLRMSKFEPGELAEVWSLKQLNTSSDIELRGPPIRGCLPGRMLGKSSIDR